MKIRTKAALTLAATLTLAGVTATPAHANGSFNTTGPVWASSGVCAQEKGTVSWFQDPAPNQWITRLQLFHGARNYVCLAPNTPTGANIRFSETLEVQYLNGSTGTYQPLCTYSSERHVFTATWNDAAKTDCPPVYTGTVITWRWSGAATLYPSGGGSITIGTYSGPWTLPAGVN